LTDEAPVANVGAMEKVSTWKRAIPTSRNCSRKRPPRMVSKRKVRQKARSDPGMRVVPGVLVFPTSVHDESNITLVAARTAHILNR